MSLSAVIMLNALLDLAVVAGLGALLLRPFLLERRAAQLPRRLGSQELRRAA